MTYLKHILILAFLAISSFVAMGQSPTNWDQDIRLIRNTAMPDFHCIADDYTQYAPAALMLGLKACGYEGRTGWGQMLTADALSIAIMTGVTQGIKYSVRRMRPDDSRRNSFPSGHTGTAFLTATMLHKEYGWRNAWWSIGGYTVAAFTGVSRIMNNKHWMSDIAAGAAIGIGSVHLGYFLSDLIFKKRYINSGYEAPSFTYDPSVKHYVAEMYFGRRLILGYDGRFHPTRGGTAGLSADIPLLAGNGITARAAASSMTYSDGNCSNLYSVLCGGFHNFHFAKRFELQAKLMAGGAWNNSQGGADILVGSALSIMLDDNFKIKGFAEYETISLAPSTPWMHSIVLGWGAAWFW